MAKLQDTTKALFLRPDIRAEPLFNLWRAWTHLIPPQTAALRIIGRQLPLLQTYLANAGCQQDRLEAHKPALSAITYEEDRRHDIQRLLDRTLVEQSGLIELAKAIQSLSRMLAGEARGYSLAHLYPRVPIQLQGYVELFYDLDDNPSFRFIEGLLYKSSYYNRQLQGYVLSHVNQDKYKYNASTPRVVSADFLHLNLHYGHSGLDLLFKSRRQPTSLSDLKNSLALDDTATESLSHFLTHSAPPARPRYDGEQVRIRYFGHAAVLIESQGYAILVDPLIGYQYPSPVRRYSYGDLPDFIDYILITHGHQDHLDLESLLQLRYQTGTVIVPKSGGELLDPSLKLLLCNIGFERVLEIDDLESVALGRGSITAIPFLGEHSDLKVRAKTSYAVRLAGQQVLCLADSCNIAPELYRHVHQLIGDVDVLFIGMECEGSPLSLANGPYLLQLPTVAVDQSRRTQASNYEQGLDVVERLNCQQVYIYAMGLEPWIQHLFNNQGTTNAEDTYSIKEARKLITECRRAGRTAELLFGQKEILL